MVNRKFLIPAIIVINSLFLLFMGYLNYHNSQNIKIEYEKQITEQANKINDLQETIKSDSNIDIESDIDTTVMEYVTAVETIEKDNYSVDKILQSIKDICTKKHYNEKQSELETIRSNRGNNKSTGGTSANVSVKEVYIKKGNDESYYAIAFSNLVNSTDGVSTNTALIYKLKLKVNGKKVLIDEVNGKQIVNGGIKGIIDIAI